MSLVTTDLPDLKLLARGKVRDVYEVDGNTILFVATDRISAFDVVMDSAIKGKGEILTQISTFWFDLLPCKNHLITTKIEEMPEIVQKYKSQLQGRSMLCKKLQMLPVEAIVRGYITGSAMVEYKKKGTVCDIVLPKGLVESQKLEKPLYTPSTKAEMGDHDENIHPDKLIEIMGEKNAKEVERLALELYSIARDYADKKGIIIADTKFEFGLNEKGEVILGDEVLTPDSSRFWPKDLYKVGKPQQRYQFFN